MNESRKGQVVTFYSYKGGTGRTMALANVAWILASSGKRVLVADWDLEAPGLHRFFSPFLDVDTVAHRRGVIDLVREYEDQVRRKADRPDGWVEQLARVDGYAFSIDWNFGGGGSLDVLSAGRQNGAYASTLGSLDWDTFYDRLGGGIFLDALRDDMRRNYDYALIDSRTGFSDVADICTQHLPDVLVDCFTLSDQGIDGAARVARAVAILSKKDGPKRKIRILPVAMRVDQGEKEKADAGRLLAMRRFPGLPTGMTEPERVQFFASVEVPYQTFYAYEETLATFGDKPGSPTSLLAAYERLTDVVTQGEVTALAKMDESVRAHWRRRFERPTHPEQTPIRLQYAAEDQIWAEWAGSVLTTAGITVVDDGPMEITQADPVPSSAPTVLAIVSKSYVAVRKDVETQDLWAGPSHLVMYIEDVRLREVSTEARTNIAGLDEKAATERLIELVGKIGAETSHGGSRIGRFPGAEPRWFQAPARNARFTGRVEDLQRLRRELHAEGRAVVLPVALQGMGGIGKTQLALEYVHRFRSAYDLVWWIEADPPQFIDSALIDLGIELKLPSEGTIEGARSTLEALRLGTPTRRWLLVFDNADDLAHVQNFLPRGGGGHLLITSRNPDWAEGANPIQVDVFQREESVAHLRGRAGAMTSEEAGQVARALGDLPIAVAAAGAWLAETGTPVAEYLQAVQLQGVGTRSVQAAWDATWDLSLQRLQEQSPGAYRLLQICSVLAPETALDLLYSNQLTTALIPFDQSVAVRDMRGALVQHINRLALLKLDTQAGQVQVHRLLQNVVRSRMTDDEAAHTRHEAHQALAAFRPAGEPDDPKTWDQFRKIWAHLEISGAVSCNDESVRQLLIDRVRYIWCRGDLPQGLSFGNAVAARWETLLTQAESSGENGQPSVPDVDPVPLRRQLLHLRFNIANILRDQARFGEALRLDEEVLAEQRILLGERHSHTLMTSGGLAADFRALGRYAEALPLEEATYSAWLEGFGENHPRTLAAANNLAVSLRTVGDFRRARSIDEDVWERRKIVLGHEHPYALHSQSSLGRDLREAGEYVQSVEILRAVHALSRKHLGPEAVGTLKAQANLASSLRSAGRADEAAELLEEAYEKLRGRFGNDNPNTLSCRLSRSANLLSMGEVTKALEEMIAVTKSYQDTLGTEHPFSLVCINNQSAAWRQQGEHERAKELSGRAAEGFLRLLGDSHPDYLAAMMNHATCCYDVGDVEGAAEEMAAAATRMGTTLGQRHPDMLACRANIALLASGGRGDGSRGLLGGDPATTRAIDNLAAQLGQDHPSVTSLRAAQLLYRVTDPHDPF
ncbi:MAG: FxSxx-COOH system tetratricopeptide repeat protein [Actinomycetota bacterium]|nr:FxSxx-COOH system tetratricopeptide repeat protein [Actinomycetota bacterium]